MLIVQSNDFNQSRIGTILIVAVTSNTALADAPGNVLLPRDITRLRKDAVANVSQVMTLDKTFFLERIGALPAELLLEVEDGLRRILCL